jgi:hypothetical protein
MQISSLIATFWNSSCQYKNKSVFMNKLFTLIYLVVPLSLISFGQNPLDVKEESVQIEKVYPNPVSNHVFVELNLQEFSNITFELVDILGVSVKKWKPSHLSPGNHKSKLELNSIRTGIYLLKINVNGKDFVKRIKKN